MKTKTVNLYTFDELSERAKERARDWWKECEAEEFDQGGNGLYEPVETAARLLGISFKTHSVRLMNDKTREESDIYWTLHVQGAGASFNGTYSYNKGNVKALAAEFPTDTVLQGIARDLAAIQKRYQYSITANIKAGNQGHWLEIDLDQMGEEDAAHMRSCFKDFAQWIYEHIRDEYEYRMSNECVDDSILANEYTFTESGKRED